MSGQWDSDFGKDFPEIWGEKVKKVSECFNAYHAKLFMEVQGSAPIHYIRYEDLVTKPQEVLEGMFCFLLEKESVEGLNIQRRIKTAVEAGSKGASAYEMKAEVDPKKLFFNRNIKMFNAE
jgi:hypothetical protein